MTSETEEIDSPILCFRLPNTFVDFPALRVVYGECSKKSAYQKIEFL